MVSEKGGEVEKNMRRIRDNGEKRKGEKGGKTRGNFKKKIEG